MAETFLSGFAQAFNSARARTEEANAEQENLMFRYKMDNLMEQKKKREAKSAVEVENARKAKDLAGQLGDPEAASIFYKEIANGVDYETLQKRVVEGDYQKNTSYKAPTQTIKMPTGVTPTTATYDAEVNPLQPKEGDGILARGAKKQYDRRMESVNQKIDSIDPSLRSEVVNPKQEFSVTQDDATSKYTFKPKNQYKIGDYGDALYKQYKAKEAGDPVAIREANEEVKIHQRIMTEKAKADALAQGKNVAKYFSINPDGTIGAQFAGERRDDGIYNISNPNGEQLVSGPVRMMDDKDVERYNKLVDDVGKASADLNAVSTNFIGALDSSQKMAQILHDNPNAATTSSNILGLINNLSGDAKAAFQALNNMENNINSKAQSGNLEGIEKDIADYTKAAEKFNGTFLSEGNRDEALAAAKFRSLQMQTAYAIAQSNASDGKVSKNDLDNAMEIIGKSNDPKIITQTVNQQMQGAFLKLTSTQRQLDMNPAVIDFEKRMGIKTGLRPTRIGDQIDQMEWPEEQKVLLKQYLNNINRDFTAGQAQTNATANPPPAQVQPQQQQVQGVEFNGMIIPEEAVGILKGRPDQRMRDYFDSQFGKGAADRVLGGK